ncbi:shikimate dehydrogenase [Pseudactinotalea sp. Z1732]|uniref:shikimate dehydrogenase n=1 Tax=Pseudactinotalea sp. Z1732 TaxID=3413026 RepID=UPI003C7BFBCC
MPDPRRAAVLGHPVAHSLSPVLHRAAYAELGLTHWTYERHDVTEDRFTAFLTGLDPSWAGLSVTMPLKQVALRSVDHIEPLAEVVGAVNTVLFPGGGVRVGTNTDVYGIVTALTEVAPTQWQPRTGVILGGGATASAALAALGQLGITSPAVVVRSPGRAGAVVRAAARMGVSPSLLTWGTPRADEALLRADAVVSTAPRGAADSLVPLIVEADLHPGQVLLDVVYEGWPTAMGRAWAARGAPVAGGHLMLLHQGVEQVRLMTGRSAPTEVMRVALERALAERS